MNPSTDSMARRIRRAASALALASLLLGGMTACRDSSCSDGSPLAGTLDVTPPAWTTRPAGIQRFDAKASGLAPGVFWIVPPGFGVVDEDSDSITLVAPGDLGPFELTAVSLEDPLVRRVVPIQVMPYGLSFRLADGPPGDASHNPFGDIAISRPAAVDGGEGPRVFVAWFDALGGANWLRTYDMEMATELLPPVRDLFFNPLQVPHVTADAHGNAYWIQQYFYDPFRWYQLGRMDATGGIVVKDYAAASFGGWWLGVGTDIASDDEGNLYLLVENGGAHSVARLSGFFGAQPGLELLAPVASPPSQVRLSVDKDGNLLVADGMELSRWTLAPGAAPSIEVLTPLPEAATDVDSDGNGVIYVTLRQQLLFLDMLGREVLEISDFTLDTGPQTYFQRIHGLGVDERGNLRVLDKPMVDLPQLPVKAGLPYLIDLPPEPALAD